jgi:hypothetical protein
MNTDATLPLENFIQAVQNQLDKAQTAMAVKAHNLNLPMTFAIKDINLDLRAHVEFSQGEIRIRPAGANEPQASVFHIVFTAITRPMIEENAVAFADDPEDQSIEELDEELTDEERRKLEWVGVRTVKQLRDLEREGASRTAGRVTNLPVSRLRRALKKASAPLVDRVSPVSPAPNDPPDFRRILRVHGRNLAPEGAPPKVSIAGRRASILKSSDNELLLAPDHEQWAGELRVETEPEIAAAMNFDLSSFAPMEEDGAEASPAPEARSGNGGTLQPEGAP